MPIPCNSLQASKRGLQDMNLHTVAEATAALKGAFDLTRTAISAVRDAASLLPNDQKKEAATQALEQAEKASRTAEAGIAKALGYELCKCQFPPTPMLTIGH